MLHSVFLLLLCLELTKMERPRQTSVCMEVSTCEQMQHWATHENRMWDNTFHFSGVKSAPKSFKFWPLYCRLSFTGSSMQHCTESREIPNLPRKCWGQGNLRGESEQLQGDESSTEKKSWRIYLDKQFADEVS